MHRWQQQYVEAKCAIQDRDAKVAEVAEGIERNLVLLGCTAIEDKLQEGVPEAIERLALAGIKIWVLTGDKQVRSSQSSFFVVLWCMLGAELACAATMACVAHAQQVAGVMLQGTPAWHTRPAH